ncbi:hypothetical protein KEM52_003130, partial [Ascosphaera acerosa]
QDSSSGSNDERKKQPHIVMQVSSVATLGTTDKWLCGTLMNAMNPRPPRNAASAASPPPRPTFSIMFPDADEIRRSLDGYSSGGSIHMKTLSTTQHMQLQYLRKYLVHCSGDAAPPSANLPPPSSPQPSAAATATTVREAGRRRAAPHIKTYVRFTDAADMASIDWALVTSANLSKQAWGAEVNKAGEVRISSWEIGVLVWPDLFVGDPDDRNNDNGGRQARRKAVMVPTFKRDTISPELAAQVQRDYDSAHEDGSLGGTPLTAVAIRMPYDLPLTPYAATTRPWTATAVYTEPDWMGQTWGQPDLG